MDSYGRDKRKHPFLSGLTGRLLFLLLSAGFLAGCATTGAYRPAGVSTSDRQAVIQGDVCQSGFARQYVRIAEVDGEKTASIWSCMLLANNAYPRIAYLEPGKHNLVVACYQYPSHYTMNLWFVAEPDKEYIIRQRAVGYDVRMWIEEKETGTAVGGIVGSADEPRPLDFREASDEVNERARQQLEAIIANGGNSEIQKGLIATNGICGPFLWAKLQPYAVMRGLTWAPAYVNVPYTDEKTGQRAYETLEGRVLQSESEALAFWGAVHYELGPTTNDVIRRLTPLEKEQLFEILCFEYLEEPIFIIESADYRLLTVMIEEDGRYLPFWMDDFCWMPTSRVTQAVSAE